MGLQAKPAYWGIVDPKQLPSAGLKFSASQMEAERKTDKKTDTLTITATNGDAGPAYTTQINGFKAYATLWETVRPTDYGTRRFPIVLGDIRNERFCQCGL
jgi:endo-1,4-beta-xylanase